MQIRQALEYFGLGIAGSVLGAVILFEIAYSVPKFALIPDFVVIHLIGGLLGLGAGYLFKKKRWSFILGLLPGIWIATGAWQ